MVFVKYAVKILAAGATAIIILSIFSFFYHYVPSHVPNIEHTTDYVWPPNSPWVLLTEGLAWGRMDEKGFNNPRQIQNPDILFMGSSHVEGKNIMREENACVLLEQGLKGKYRVYNIGMSGHTFFKVCHYLPAVFRKYKDKPPAFLIIETSSVIVTGKMVDDILQNKYQYRPPSRGIGVRLLQKVPVAVFLHRRWENGLKSVFMPQEKNSFSAEELPQDSPSSQVCSRLFGYLAEMVLKNGTKLIIVYHPKETFLADGSITFLEKEWTGAFADAAKQNGILFVDMSEAFEKMFSGEHHAPHGFVNGKIGHGHLNKYGHRAIAQELKKIIAESGREKSQCR